MNSGVQLGRLATSLVALHQSPELARILNQISRIYSAANQNHTQEIQHKYQQNNNKIAIRCLELLDVKKFNIQLCQLAMKVLLQVCKQDGTQIQKMVISKGLLDKINKLLRCDEEDIIEVACAGLCEICEWQCADMGAKLQKKCLHTLVELLVDVDVSIEMQSCCLCSLVSAVRKGANVMHIATQVFSCIARLLMTSDEDILRNSIWMLLEMAKSLTQHQIETFIRSGICLRLIGLTQHKTTDISSLALQLISEITPYNSVEALDCGLLPALKQIARVRFSDAFIMTRICSIVADISKDAPQRAVKSKIVPIVLYVARDSDYYGRQAQWSVIRALHYLCTRGNNYTLQYALKEGCMDYLLESLQIDYNSNPRVFALILSTISHMLATEDSSYTKQLTNTLQQKPTYQLLQKLSECKHAELRHHAVQILFVIQCIGKHRHSSSPKSVFSGLSQKNNSVIFNSKQYTYDLYVSKMASGLTLTKSNRPNAKLKTVQITN